MKIAKYLSYAALISLSPVMACAQSWYGNAAPADFDVPAAPAASAVEATFPEDKVSRAPEGSLYGATFKWERNQASAPTWDLRSAGCGLIASEALLRFFKNDPGMDKIMEIRSIASQSGYWTANDGMTNREAEKNLVERLFRDNGVNAQVDLVPHTDLQQDMRVIRESLDRGKPVIINTSQHYFFAEGYDNNGNLYVGYTGTVKTGNTQMNLGYISSSSGGLINFIVPR